MRRMEAKGEARVIHFADMDSHRYPCITARKQAIQQDFDLRNDEIQIVIEEIESWYYAGVDETNRETLGVMSHDSTDRLTKEAFNELVPSSYGLRTDFLEEILKHYSFDSALRRNRSFAYFVTKYGLVMPDQSPVSSA
ncbi:MAG: hypothetical protein O3A46_00460 [Candidatus Poribacteria bacterium]|nr:hypothetical protein [Candidatus Poribacteria bacterium]